MVHALLFNDVLMHGFINRVSSAATLKDNLDIQQDRVRAIAARVSQASLNNQDGFSLPTSSLSEDRIATDVDLETEMTNLADAQLRYEATTRLLSKTYAQIRSSMRER